MLLSETLFAFLLTLSVWSMIMAARKPSTHLWLQAGIVSGLTVLLREETMVMFLLFVGSVLSYGEKQYKIRNLLILSLGLLLMVGVWTLRNYIVFKETIMVSANSGRAIWISTVGWHEFRDEEPYRSLVRDLNELERNHVLLQEGIKNISNDPAHYLRLCFQRIAPFWLGSHTTYLAGFSESFKTYYARGALLRVFVKVVLFSVNMGLLGLALWGAWVSLLRDSGQRYVRRICFYPIATIATVHFFLFATSRYLVSVLPFVLIFSAIGMDKASSRFRTKTTFV